MSEIRPRRWADLDAARLWQAVSDPPNCYRPVPWLAWTGELSWPGLRAQLTTMREQGIREFFLFPVYGMELPYMSLIYWERVAQTLDFCREQDMKCWIYDEYNWPSGVCAGAVLRDHPEAREKLLWLRLPTVSDAEAALPPEVHDLNQSGGTTWAVAPGTETHINVRGCDWLSALPGYLDVLSPEACRRFIESTHDRYYQQAPGMFPETIPGFFTDEPGYHSRPGTGWLGLPYTEDLFSSFRERYGYDLREHLGDLLEGGPGAARTRCHYWRWIAERFGEAYGKQQRDWCDAHGVALTGHGLGEETLRWHVGYSGDLWEALRHFTIPGIDMLSNADGFTYPDCTAFYGDLDRRGFHLVCKLIHGIVRHSGGREMLSEAYGVCDWGMGLARQKRGCNYQVALGVTLFNDNSLITSVADFRKHVVGGKHFTQPWWCCYHRYADYNARVVALHAEGDALAEVAVLYPRSTVWAATDRVLLTSPSGRAQVPHPLTDVQELIYDLCDELIRRQWPFDFVFEPILATATVQGNELVTAHARYRAIVIPSATHLPQACAQVLADFAAAGGLVMLAGAAPANDPETGVSLAATVAQILAGPHAAATDPSGPQIAETLAQELTRPVVLDGDGARDFVTSWRRLAGSDLVFVANMAAEPRDVRVTVNAPGPCIVADPDTLEQYRPAFSAGEHACHWHFEPWQGFVILTGEAADPAHVAGELPAAPPWLTAQPAATLDGDWEFSVEPGNIVRLPIQVRPDPQNSGAAEGWHHDTGDAGWITPVDNRIPEPIRPAEAPWYWMRARVDCAPGVRPEWLIADSPDFLEVYVNGRPARQVAGPPVWAEENVRFEVADLLVTGENTIHARARTSKYNDPRIAPMVSLPGLQMPLVLLGDFLVDDAGRLVPWTGRISPERSWEQQGLPHFGGVGCYRRRLDLDTPGRLFLHLPACADAVEVRVNGQVCGITAWPPYVFDLSPHLTAGGNELEVRVYNTFGNLITETYGGARGLRLPVSGLTCPPVLLQG